ncbi:MAG TPA: cysteine--tRNA ligase, partial [Geobacterales bacterium]|nr:cysteine--tRNA ligase [Geobacterales bacterium]
RNYTDIDDKIINRANAEGVSYREIADRYIATFDEDMAALALALPTHQPKATDHIDDIIALVQRLIDKGVAYQAGGDVYFCVEKFPSYLKLSGRTLEDMQAGARIEVDERKRHPMDFALWKEAKPGEPWWESPWGKGRPGWHIECSAMGMRLLGESFDIHGGGKDLIFPHHENEIAQSEAASGKPFVKYWLHNGFVTINQEKMSKSLGNFFTIQQVLEKFDHEVLRFFLLTAHYRSPIDFSDQHLAEAESGLERIYAAIESIEEVQGKKIDTAAGEKGGEALQELAERLERFASRVQEAMGDDFNTAQVMGHVFDLVRSINRCVAECSVTSKLHDLLGRARSEIVTLADILGIFATPPVELRQRLTSRKLAGLNIDTAEIERLIEERVEARRNKQYGRGDEIRDQLLARGIVLLDSPQGTTWRVK